MAHNKVFGHCENLCEVEVVAKENIAVITGTKELAANDMTYDYKQTTWDIDYPEGFNKDNCICLAFQGSVNTKVGAYGTTPNTAANLAISTLPRTVCLQSDNINLQCYNPASSAKQYIYKVVLLKVVDDTVVEGGSNDGGLVSGGSPVNRPSYGG